MRVGFLLGVVVLEGSLYAHQCISQKTTPASFSNATLSLISQALLPRGCSKKNGMPCFQASRAKKTARRQRWLPSRTAGSALFPSGSPCGLRGPPLSKFRKGEKVLHGGANQIHPILPSRSHTSIQSSKASRPQRRSMGSNVGSPAETHALVNPVLPANASKPGDCELKTPSFCNQ